MSINFRLQCRVSRHCTTQLHGKLKFWRQLLLLIHNTIFIQIAWNKFGKLALCKDCVDDNGTIWTDVLGFISVYNTDLRRKRCTLKCSVFPKWVYTFHKKSLFRIILYLRYFLNICKHSFYFAYLGTMRRQRITP